MNGEGAACVHCLRSFTHLIIHSSARASLNPVCPGPVPGSRLPARGLHPSGEMTGSKENGFRSGGHGDGHREEGRENDGGGVASEDLSTFSGHSVKTWGGSRWGRVQHGEPCGTSPGASEAGGPITKALVGRGWGVIQ